MGGADELRDPRRAADRRDAAATARDEAAEQRDTASLTRDVEAGARDRNARRRDSETAFRLHDLVERLRLLRGEILDRLDRLDAAPPGRAPQEPHSGFPTTSDDAMNSVEDRAALEALLDEVVAVVNREAAVQGAAAGDRRRSARDRQAAAEDRRASAADRDRSGADREEAAIDREQVDYRTKLGLTQRDLHASRAGAAQAAEAVERLLAETRERVVKSKRLLTRLPDPPSSPKRRDDQTG
ncbi:hypothetical protein GCM10023215_47120 [Pseudonocardia yuanmonensis]|uniref:Uncharacterized protein n=1 Tax=Pseudonocardia yuanmonensis TaxID=1095914 RepID=A0ABP8X9R0_9PSEU